MHIRLHATHQIVRRRTDRNGIAGQVEAHDTAHLGNRWKASPDELGVEMRQRQEYAAAALFLFADDAAGHDVARSEIAARMIAGHERLAAVVDQAGALAAERF